MSELDAIDISSLTLVKYPDPRLRETCRPVERFDSRIRALTEKMFALMYESNGVGMAGPQAGVAIRLFCANPTGEPSAERVYINPELVDNQGEQEGDEGCLSFPGVFCKIKRYETTIIRAQDLDGATFEETAEGLLARILQHERDHLDGRLLVDRMSPVARIANRRSLKDLQAEYAGQPVDQPGGKQRPPGSPGTPTARISPGYKGGRNHL